MKVNYMLRKYLISGLLIWIPILVTMAVISFIIDLVDQTLPYLPDHIQPDKLFGVHIPGLGVLFTVLILFTTGLVATNFFGRRLVALVERLLEKIPLVRSIYRSTKQVTVTLFSPNSQSFRKVVLIEYPRQGVWTVAFQTGNGLPTLKLPITTELITVFVPSTPNPTSGFLLLVPKSQAIELDLSIDEALKLVISLGVVPPGDVKPVA
jgi:uncharacterized membrane protein